MRSRLAHAFNNIICVENLLTAWQEFIVGKRSKKDVQIFAFRLMDNIFQLHYELRTKTYRHGGYQGFYIFDPKPRHIHKSSVRDRLVHNAVYRVLYPFYDTIFISDSYSCRENKGTHKALERFTYFSRIASKNNTKTCWVLKCDIKKFFDNINHEILLNILKQRITHEDVIWLIKKILGSFHKIEPGVGLPLGNITSQLFVNIYMNEFDQFVKHQLKEKQYIRYADDFVVFSDGKKHLESLISVIQDFLLTQLGLRLHPDKLFIKTLASGIDFLGWVHFPDHCFLPWHVQTWQRAKIKSEGREKSNRPQP